jgi:MYXO-CTERM domain-containing protein
MKASLRTSLATLVGSVALLVAPAAFALGEPCFNDTDCPGGGAVCGGDVCDWNQMHATSTSADPKFVCIAAGSTNKKGAEGWCTTNDNCKCKGEGATCVGVYCTFTTAPAGGAGTGAGGGSGMAGSSSTAGTGTAGTGTAGTGTTMKPAEEEGGCSVSAPGASNTGLAAGVAILGLGLAFARRRRG